MAPLDENPASTQTAFPGDLGPIPVEGGILYRVWALGRKSITAQIWREGGEKRTLELTPETRQGEEGYFRALDPRGTPGDLYQFSIDGRPPLPDFASHYQPRGVHGPSQVVDARQFAWRASHWRRPAWRGQVIYEIHLGTFTPEGTFRAAIGRLDHLADLGVTAIEIMPVAEWGGGRNWGYDGVLLFAPSCCYGTPDDFRALIDAAHLRGLAVILDLVYNHLGPDGNYSHDYSDYYFHQGRDNPWGQNFNLEGPHSAPVRALLRQNVRYWLDEFRMDGFRMDATHTIHDPSIVHLLAEVAEIVHSRGAFIVAEDDRNARSILEPQINGGWQFDALWSDDFHHIIRISQTGEQEYFFCMFRGSADEVTRTLQQGWFYSGEVSPFHQGPRGTRADDFPPECFVYCISNHDQCGNRLVGERLNHVVTPASYRALSLFLCLVPATPLLFMGQEWATARPFHYFTDMPPPLGDAIRQGRRAEFLKMEFARNEADLARNPDPQALATFEESKLDWSEPERESHRQVLDLYRRGLKLRRELFVEGNPPRGQWTVESLHDGVVIHYHLARPVSVYLHLKKVAAMPKGRLILRSSAPEFGGSADFDAGRPETIVVERD
jgi:maltooligosyltrehalose trehalohydrolase